MSPAQRPAAVDYRSLAEFRYHLRIFLRQSEEIARDAGIEPQQHQLLLAIKGAAEGQEVSIGYLSDRLQVKHNSAVGLVDRLQARGLVRRRRDAGDRRRVSVEITAKGERLLRQLSQQNLAVLHSTRGLLKALSQLARQARFPVDDANSKRDGLW